MILESCKICNLRFDNTKGGNFTCVTRRGSIAVDLTLCSAELLHDVKQFHILSSSMYSDHRPKVFHIESDMQDKTSEARLKT